MTKNIKKTNSLTFIYQTLFLLLLALPIIFQIIFGRKAIAENIKLTFFKICLITFLSQFISFIIAFKILSNKLRVESNGQIHCGMPFVGLIGLEILITIIIVVIILVQYLIKRSYNRTNK